MPKLLTVSALATSPLDGHVRVFDASGQEIANNDDPKLKCRCACRLCVEHSLKLTALLREED